MADVQSKKGPSFSILRMNLVLYTYFFLQLYVVAGSFIKERHDLDDNSCRTCNAHGMLAVAMKLDASVYVFTSYLVSYS